MKDLKNKNIVITGASSGIGEKVAFHVAREGARPILIARSEEKLKAIVKDIHKHYQIDSLYYAFDIRHLVQVEQVFKQIEKEVGKVDILLNNAGFGVFDTVADAKMEEIEAMFATNVLGLIACTKAILPQMMEHNRGHIINIASQAGKVATPKSGAYAATKHAVLGFTNSLRLELNDTNIFVSAVNPGPIETNFFKTADRSGNYVKNVRKYMLTSDFVAEKIIHLMKHPKPELNLPRWMQIGTVLYQLFPRIADKFMAGILDRK